MSWFCRSVLVILWLYGAWFPTSLTAQSPEFWEKYELLAVRGDFKGILELVDTELTRSDLTLDEQQSLHQMRIETLSVEGRFEESLLDAERQLHSDSLPPEIRLQYELARIGALSTLDRVPEALALCNEKLADADLDPDHRMTWTLQRLSLMGISGQTKEALSEVSSLLANPSLTEIERAVFKSLQLRFLMEQEDWTGALDSINAALADERTEEWQVRHLLLQRAEVYDHMGRPEMARADRDEAGIGLPYPESYSLSQAISHWLAARTRPAALFENMKWWLGSLVGVSVIFIAIGNRQRREGDGTYSRLIMVSVALALLTLVPVATYIAIGSRIPPEHAANAAVMVLLTTGVLLFCHVLTLFPPIRWLSGSEALPEAAEELIARTHAIAQSMGLPQIKVRVMPSFNLEAQAFAGGLVAPSIVLVDGILHRFNAEERDAIIAHELGHLANGTLWWFVLVRPLAAVFSILVAGYTGVPEAILWAILVYLGLFQLVSRRLEFDSDRRAAGIAGVPATISALDKVHAVHRLRNQGFWSRIAYATSTHPGRDARLSAVASINPSDAAFSNCEWSELEVRSSQRWSWFFGMLWLVVLAAIFIPSVRTWYFWPAILMLWFPFLAHQMAFKPEFEGTQTKTMRHFWIVTGLILLCYLLSRFSNDGPIGLLSVAAAVVALLIPVSIVAWLINRFRPNPAVQILQALQQRRFELVLELAEKFDRQIQKVPEARHNVALAKFLLHHDAEAIDDFELLREDFPKYDGAWQLLIWVFQELNQVMQAFELLEELRSTHTKDLAWNAAMFDNALRRGQLAEARGHVKVVEELLGESSPGCAARLASEEGNGEHAWACLAEAERKSPGDVGIASLKVRFALRHGPAEKVAEYLAEAESLAQANPFAMCERRIARLRQEWEEQNSILEPDDTWLTSAEIPTSAHGELNS